MKYLKISNAGKMPKTLLHLIGASTKKGNSKKIGEFGTGLKYAIAYLLRTGNKFKFFSGKEEFVFTVQKQKVSGIEFSEIFCNDKSTSITTSYGDQWQAWEIVRELWCNAKDEGKERKKITDEGSVISGDVGRTSIYIELTEDIQNVVNNWELYFNNRRPLFENERFAIYKSNGDKCRIYKNKVLIKELENSSLFDYDFKSASLNELRQYMGYYPSDVLRSILNSSQEVARIYLEAYKAGKKVIETSIKYNSISSFDVDYDRVKYIFEGYMFISDSKNPKSTRIIPAEQEMFNFLQRCGCVCERMETYSAGVSLSNKDNGIESDGEFRVKRVIGSLLHERISKIARKFDLDIDFEIVTHCGDNEADVFVSHHEHKYRAKVLNFSIAIDEYNEQELEATVLTANLFSTETNSYKTMKRIIKFLKENKNFMNIYHGRRIK